MWAWVKLFFGFCPHATRQLLRRGPNGRMGLECPDCFNWTPIEIEWSRAAWAMERRQEAERWARRAREGFKLFLVKGA